MIWKRLLAFFIPSLGALTLLWAALGVISLLSMTALVSHAICDIRNSTRFDLT